MTPGATRYAVPHAHDIVSTFYLFITPAIEKIILKLTSGGPKNQGMRVVLDVTEGLRGHNETCNNFFTSYELGQQLLKRKITMVGTV